MNFIFALFIFLASQSEPHVFFYNGKTLAELNVIAMPNVGSETFKFFVSSQYELRSASMDSSEVGLCLPAKSLMKQLNIKGRWYAITWETKMKVGSNRHTIYLTARSGKIYREKFIINVEGNKKVGKPLIQKSGQYGGNR